MTPDQATALAKRVINTMRPTPALGEWIEVLEPLDFEAALRTFRDLRERVEDGLRIATFAGAYQRVTAGPDAPTARRCDPSPTCEHCRGDGFEPGPSRWGTINGEPYEYTTVQPCRCTNPTPPRQRAPVPSLLEEF